MILIHLFISFFLHAAEPPTWYAKDIETKEGWAYFCSATAEDEAKALTLARNECADKLCRLFGETNADCPKVRAEGRVEKKKLVECAEADCHAYVSHFYSKNDFKEEQTRRNGCTESLAAYSKIVGESYPLPSPTESPRGGREEM